MERSIEPCYPPSDHVVMCEWLVRVLGKQENCEEFPPALAHARKRERERRKYSNNDVQLQLDNSRGDSEQ